jgi:hypothetical protein
MNDTQPPNMPTPDDPQLDIARAANNTWTFEGKEYAKYMANRTGTIGTPIIHPVSNKKVGILIADFAWSEAQPFLDHLDLKLKDERNVREEVTERKRANLRLQNANLFDATVQQGSIVKLDEFGDQSEPILKKRDAMLAYPPEIKSEAVDTWLGEFHIERYFHPGTDEVELLLAEPESIWFTAKVGDYKNPAHMLLFEFSTPSPDARRNYENDTFIPGSKNERNKITTYYFVNNKAKLNFAKKYFKSVSGAVLGKDGEIEVDTADLKPIQDAETVKQFTKAFNPYWWIQFADAIAGAFSIGGK